MNADSKPVAGRVGRIDRLARVVLGATLLLFAVCCPFAARLGPVATWGSGLIGVALMATAARARCPLYRLLGVRT